MFATELELAETAPDVRLAMRKGAIVVIHTGAARCEAWLAELNEAGLFPAQVRPRAQG